MYVLYASIDLHTQEMETRVFPAKQSHEDGGFNDNITRNKQWHGIYPQLIVFC